MSWSAERSLTVTPDFPELRSARGAWTGLEPLGDFAGDPLYARRIQVADLAEQLESTEAYAEDQRLEVVRLEAAWRRQRIDIEAADAAVLVAREDARRAQE